MRGLVIPLLFVALLCLAARAEESEEPTYADKPASWWIEEVLADESNRAATEVVRRMGEGAVPALTRALAKTEATRERRLLLSLLAGMKRSAAPALTTVSRSLHSADFHEQEAALRVLAGIREEAQPALAEVAALLTHKRARIRRGALGVLRAIGPPSAAYVGEIVELLDDEEARTRASALGVLGSLGPRARRALPALEVLIESDGLTARTLRTLVSVAPESEGSRAALLTAAGTEDEHLRKAVTDLLTSRLPVGETLRSVAEELATRGGAGYQKACAQALGRWLKEHDEVPEVLLARGGAPERALARIHAALDSDDDAVRRVAVVAALELTDEQLVSMGGALLRVLDARGPMSGHPATYALARIAPWAPDARRALLALADDPEHPAHASVPGHMEALGDKGRDRLIALLKSPIRNARRNAAVTLLQMSINAPESAAFAHEALTELANDDDLELAGIAKKAREHLDRYVYGAR